MAKASTCKGRYERLATDRQTFLDRARQCAELTIPTLIPPEGHTKSTKFHTPWQGIGARGVNNLASKLLLALLPVNSPCFKLTASDYAVQELAGGDPSARAKIDEGLNKIERAVQSEVEGTGMRSPVFLALKHLIVGGNVLLYLPHDGGVRTFALDSYVVIRDPKGNVLEIIIKETMNREAIPDDLAALLKDNDEGLDTSDLAKKAKEDGDPSIDDLEIYTKFYREGRRWRMYQEVEGKEVPGSRGSWPIDKSPMIPLRWTHVENEDYGRSHVEEYLGDLVSLEGLSKAIVEAAAVAAKMIFLTNPNGVTRAKDLSKAETGDFVVGSKDDVHCLQADKQADMSIAANTAKEISERLAYSFLLQSAIQRKGERVTAEEIRYMAGELEAALGGVYSVLSQEFQLPFINRIMDRMQKQKRLPALPKNVVKPEIVTGLEALGRGQDLSKYQQFISILTPLAQAKPEILARLNAADFVKRIGTSLMIDMSGLIMSDEEFAALQQQAQQKEQQQQMMDMAGKAVPNAVNALSNHSLQQGEQASAEQPA